MEHAEGNPDSEFATIMRRLLNRYVIRAQDRKLLGLEPRAQEEADGSGKPTSDDNQMTAGNIDDRDEKTVPVPASSPARTDDESEIRKEFKETA